MPCFTRQSRFGKWTRNTGISNNIVTCLSKSLQNKARTLTVSEGVCHLLCVMKLDEFYKKHPYLQAVVVPN